MPANRTEVPTESALDEIAAALTTRGYAIRHDFLPESLIEALHDEVHSLDRDDFAPAGTGRETRHAVNPRIRSDRILWLQGTSPAVRAWLDHAEHIRQGLNRRLFMGLFDYECHYARYDRGSFYKRHLDAFIGEKNRVLSTVLYLNRDWRAEDEGELRLYSDGSDDVLESLLPEYNTFVCFLSERFPHEVRPARRRRYSVAGWYRVRNS